MSVNGPLVLLISFEECRQISKMKLREYGCSNVAKLSCKKKLCF